MQPDPRLLESARRILIIRRDNIGDLLLTTPLIAAVRHASPEATVAVLATSYNAPILAGNTDIDAVYRYTKAKHSDRPRIAAWVDEARVFMNLRRQHFDLLIHANPVPHPRTGRLARFINARARLGVVGEGERKSGFNLPLKPSELEGTHHAERVFSLLRPLGVEGSAGPLKLSAPAPGGEVPVLPNAGPHPLIGIQLSSRKRCNRWPEQSYAALIEALLKHGYDVALFWAPGAEDDPRHPGDDGLAQRLHARQPQTLAMPTRTLPALVGALAQVDAMITPDGGALHIAAALGKPTVALFGCTDPAIWGPWQVPHRICRGETSATDIDPLQVEQALAELLDA
jgi:heptosyltransferase-3